MTKTEKDRLKKLRKDAEKGINGELKEELRHLEILEKQEKAGTLDRPDPVEAEETADEDSDEEESEEEDQEEEEAKADEKKADGASSENPDNGSEPESGSSESEGYSEETKKE